MKRIVLFSLLILSVGTLAFSQSMGRSGWGRNSGPRSNYPGFPEYRLPNRNRQVPRPAAEKVTIAGNLTIAQGTLAIKSGDLTYLLPGLNRYVGFIDTLKDGAQVSIEGTAMAFPQDAKTKVLMITKLTIGGKDYDFERPQWSFRSQQPPQPPRQPVRPYGRSRTL